MEEAIIGTLKFFDYPLKAYEIHKWLIGKKAKLRQVEKALIRLNNESRIKNKGDYFFLRNNQNAVKKDNGPGLWGLFPRVNPLNILVMQSRSGLVVVKASDELAVKEKNLKNAHLLLSLKVLWQRGNAYSLLLEENSWAFKYFPNWTSNVGRA